MAEKKKRRKKKKIGKWIVLGVIAVIVIGTVALNSMSGGVTPEIVTSATVSSGQVIATIGTSGVVKSQTSRTYYADISLKVSAVNVKAGDTVTAGERLIEFDEDDIMLAISEATMSFDADNSTYLARVQSNQEHRATYNQAAADVTNYEALIEAQEQYIDGLKDGISAERQERQEAILYEMESLNITNLSYQREISKLQGQMDAGNANDIRDQINYYEKEIMSNNMRLQQLQTESTLLQDFEAADNKDELLEIAQRDLSDMQEELARARTERDTAENAILNNNEVASLNTGNELLNLQTADKLERLETALDGITAEFDGVVTSVSVTEGARVGEGTVLITVESSEELVVRFGASKYDLEDLAVGQPAVVTITGNEYEGELTHIDHMATSNESGSSMVMAEVTILNPDESVYLGVDGKVKITTATEENTLVVPVEAVNTDRTGDFCYVIEDGVARVRYVTTGISSSTEIQIIEGLQEGEEVITTISGTLADGVPVIVMNNEYAGMEEDGADAP